jgi:SNF2 family DNA or RNA helicase
MATEQGDSEDGFMSLHSSYSYSIEALLHVMNVPFSKELTAESPQIQQPSAIRIPLKAHQRAVVHAMKEHELQGMNGIPYKGSKTYMNYGILGDEVGSGKSLAVLSFIAERKQEPIDIHKHQLYPYSRSNLFTTYVKKYPAKKSPALIIVPHTLYRQWQDYCKKQTTLDVFYAKSVKDLAPAFLNLHDSSGNSLSEHLLKQQEMKRSLQVADVVLVSNTMYAEVQHVAKLCGIQWSRIFIDEADSIHIPGTAPAPNAPFVWFITATWPTMLLHGHHIRANMLLRYREHPERYCSALGEWLKSEIGVSPSGYPERAISWMRVRSANWMRDYFSDHVLRGVGTITCSKEFLKESQKMPAQVFSTVWCLQSNSHRAVLGLVSAEVQNMIHAGNIEGALQQLGVTEDTTTNLVEAARKERTKELERLKKTLAFKESMDYATPQAKEVAIQTLKGKIASVEQQLKTFEERLSATQEDCPICYEDPKQNQATLTPCCHRIFCGSCILNSLSRRSACPLCRTEIQLKELVQIVSEEKKKPKKSEKSAEPKLLSKPKQLLKFLAENPNARVLVFSRYENPFVSLEKDCQDAGITYHTLRGNKDAIANTVKSFEKGEKRVLFLPTQTTGAGLNLVSATHVVLLHAMTPEEEKQVIGRAYRLGRTETLQIVKLLHEGETVATVA